MFVSIDRPDFQGFAEQLDRIPDQLPAVCSRAVKRETGDELAVLQGHADTVWTASFSPDGRRVVTASRDRPTVGRYLGDARAWRCVA
jgi:WD40 repeat protein